MKTFEDCLQNPTEVNIKGEPTRVEFKMVSVMCDNRSEIIFVKTEDDFFKVRAKLPSGMGNSISNYQFGCNGRDDLKATQSDLQWWAAEGKWWKIAKVLNSGTARITSVRHR